VTHVLPSQVDVIRAPTRYTGGGYNSRKYLLVGTLRCRCGEKLRATKSGWSKTRKAEGHFSYTCPASSTGRGCGGTRIDGPDTDAWAVLAVIARHQREAAERQAEHLPRTWPGQEELSRVLEDIADHRKARRERKISAEEYFEALAQFEAEKRALIADQNKWTRAQAEAQGTPVDLAADWDRLSLAQQRAYIERALIAIEVKPAAYKHKRQPVAERLVPVWRRL
jgi:site-specific DNA recombinase